MDFEKPATIKALAYFHAILNVIINIHFYCNSKYTFRGLIVDASLPIPPYIPNLTYFFIFK